MIPATEELIGIIERNFESKSLDYKGPTSWDTDDKGKCCGLVKDVLAFANTEGGYIVIGVSEADQGFELTGVTPEQAATFESSALCRFVQNYSDPPINVRVQKVVHQQKNFVILEIPRFSDTPHLCQKDFPNVLSDRTLYVRTNNNESAPIKSSADFRVVIENAIRNRKDSLLSSVRAILTGTQLQGPTNPNAEEQFQVQVDAARKRFDEVYSLGEKGYTFFVETTFIPQDFDQYRFLSYRLKSAAHRASVMFTGWPFLPILYDRPDWPSFTDHGLEGTVCWQDLAKKDAFDFWRFNESGLFYKKGLNPYSGSAPPVISAPGILRQFAEAIYCMTRLYEELLDDSEVMNLRVIFFGTRNRSLIWDHINTYPFPPRSSHYITNRPQLEAIASYPLAEWRAGLSDHAIELAIGVMRKFDFDQPDVELMKTLVTNLFARRF
jgi:Putative DNA-binding domain